MKVAFLLLCNRPHPLAPVIIMASHKFTKGPSVKEFSIDDAFDDSLDEVIVRVYGSTTTSVSMDNKSPFRSRPKIQLQNEGLPPQQQQNSGKGDKNTSGASPHGNSHLHSHPVLLSIKTGILPDDVIQVVPYNVMNYL